MLFLTISNYQSYLQQQIHCIQTVIITSSVIISNVPIKRTGCNFIIQLVLSYQLKHILPLLSEAFFFLPVFLSSEVLLLGLKDSFTVMNILCGLGSIFSGTILGLCW